MLLLNLITTLLFWVTSIVSAADTSAWKSRNIYFVLTDRIARSSSDTGGGQCNDLGNYCGGTFKGLESKLDYIKGLGFDAIWITPVVSNKPAGYHGYWAEDLYAINSNYGSAADLKSLVNTAHSKGIYMMVDVVANHMGPGSITPNRPEPLNQASSYHSACDINYNNQNSVEQCQIAGLPDINTGNSAIRTLLQDWVSWLVKEYNFDGVRIDTVKHVEKDFWPGFSAATGVYNIGEVFDGNPTYLAEYAKLMPGLLNYATYYPMNNFYQQKGSAQALVDMMNTVSNTFPDPSALGNFLDNHDNKRWLNVKNDKTLLKNALAYVILARGIPIVYYGTEQGYAGGDDPANREDLWRSGFNTNSDLYQAIKKLSGARKSAGGLAGNDHVHLYVADTAYAWSRAGGNLIVLTTNAGGNSNAQHCFNTQKANGKWSNVYGNGAEVTADGNGRICVTATNGEPVVLVAGSGTPTGTTMSTLTATATSTACPTAVSVSFTHRVVTVPGDTIRITGNTAQLGNWTPSKGLALSASSYTSSNPVWKITVPFAAGSSVQYKFVKISSGGTTTWEADPNRSYTAPTCQASASLSSSWQGTIPYIAPSNNTRTAAAPPNPMYQTATGAVIGMPIPNLIPQGAGSSTRPDTTLGRPENRKTDGEVCINPRRNMFHWKQSVHAFSRDRLAQFSVTQALAALALARLYTPQAPPQADLSGQTAIVTGANSGIGFSIATSLAKQGATVYLACRNREKGAAAVKAIVSSLIALGGDAAAAKRVILCPLDVSDLNSVRDFCSKWETENQGQKINMLVHNAGIAEPPRNVRPTDDKGRNLIHVTNFLGSFLMTRLLEGQLSDDARVVFTSSTGHFGAIDTVLDARPPGRSSKNKDAQGLFERAVGRVNAWLGWDDSPAPAYYHSKAHQVLFASLLQRYFDASTSKTRTAHAFSPGFSSTAIFADFSLGWRAWVSSPLFALLKVSHRYVAVSTDEAAKTGVWLAACGGRGDDGKAVGGGYWEWMERKMSLVDFERARLGEVFKERVEGVWRAWEEDTECEWNVKF
ncbi:carbohydrate-binding module family 20 protein [Stemphylium lycopersici]|nr:carbohydrate-binding module family 20 protein [Stemphylium lycopersici]RAR04835.1 carbohydrate-binding module family 20 protein [Stemphylium lycopersici]